MRVLFRDSEISGEFGDATIKWWKITYEIFSFIVSFLEYTAKDNQGDKNHGLKNDEDNGSVWDFDLKIT